MVNKIIIAVVVLALAGGTIFAFTGDDDSSDTTSSATFSNSAESVDQVESGDEGVEDTARGSGEIMAYSETSLAESKTEDNIIFFHAVWCTVCNSVEKSLNATGVPEDVSIFKIDYDSDEGQALAEKYNIPIQYTMVQVDKSGNEITQWVNQFNDGIEEIRPRIQ